MPEDQRSAFAYSIRIKLLTEGEDGHVDEAERGFKTCQLHSRHWAIAKEASDPSSVEHVRGDGVIGYYPLLFEGGYRNDRQVGRGIDSVEKGKRESGIFVYQSCSGAVRGGCGAFGGELRFVPGSLAEPEGVEFDVEVGTVPLFERPAFIF